MEGGREGGRRGRKEKDGWGAIGGSRKERGRDILIITTKVGS